jgi:hypothetical protein
MNSRAQSDFEIWFRGELELYEEEDYGDFSVDEISIEIFIDLLFKELEHMKPDILESLKWL